MLSIHVITFVKQLSEAQSAHSIYHADDEMETIEEKKKKWIHVS